jgi:hypothetical protein
LAPELLTDGAEGYIEMAANEVVNINAKAIIRIPLGDFQDFPASSVLKVSLRSILQLEYVAIKRCVLNVKRNPSHRFTHMHTFLSLLS